MTGNHDFLVARQPVILVRLDQVVVRRLISARYCAFPVRCSATRRCDRMCSARSPVSSGSSQMASGPHQPQRVRLPSDVHQLVVVVEDVIGDAIDDAAQRRLLRLVRRPGRSRSDRRSSGRRFRRSSCLLSSATPCRACRAIRRLRGCTSSPTLMNERAGNPGMPVIASSRHHGLHPAAGRSSRASASPVTL